MKSLQGYFLVASPHLPDPNFYRTVVLMMKHDAAGAVGLVLNRPRQSTVAEVWKQYANGTWDTRQLTYWGGPVDGPPLVLHTQRDCAQSEILPGLMLATRKRSIGRVIRSGKTFRMLLGYSGWGPGQLEMELNLGGWLFHPATPADVFIDPELIWKRITGKIGLEILAPTIGRKAVPEQPWLN